jgi:hypothetical protein
MPNWVSNVLVVEGDSELLQKLKEQLNKPVTKYHRDIVPDGNGKWKMQQGVQQYDNPVISFFNVIAPPNLDRYFGDQDKDGIWYDWNIMHWGTKWDVAVRNEDQYPDTTLEDDNGALMYRFETAWSPVNEIVRTLSVQYPTLTFDYSYEEEQGWGGEYKMRNSLIRDAKVWDIPGSHADYENIGRPCVCEYDEAAAYEDCPIVKETV